MPREHILFRQHIKSAECYLVLSAGFRTALTLLMRSNNNCMEVTVCPTISPPVALNSHGRTADLAANSTGLHVLHYHIWQDQQHHRYHQSPARNIHPLLAQPSSESLSVFPVGT
jgi:hypothetical protein